MPESPDPGSSTPTRRNISVAFGILFVVIAVAIVVTSTAATRLGAGVAAIVLGGLGVDLVISALRGTPSLLSRIGPLP